MNQLRVSNFSVYTDKTGKQEAVFKYSWAFHPYQAGEKFLKISLEVNPIKHPQFASGDNVAPANFPKLEKVLLKLRQKYSGMLFNDELQSVGFAFSNYDMLLEFINTTSAVMRVNGVVADPVISRLSAFPSYEYANEMLQHVFNTAVTLPDIEKYMKACAKLDIKEYDEHLFDVFPLTSQFKFDPNKDTDMSFFSVLLEEKISSNKEAIDEIGGDLRKACDTFMADEQKELSDEAKLSQGFWF